MPVTISYAPELSVLIFKCGVLLQIAAGSKTVLGIAGVSEVLDQVTGHLRTLR